MTYLPAEAFSQRVLTGLSVKPEKRNGTPRVVELHENQQVSAPGETIDLTDLEGIEDDTAFLEESYRRILRREPDLAGLLHHRESLRTGTSRAVILQRFTNSEEARSLGFRYIGVEGLPSETPPRDTHPSLIEPFPEPVVVLERRLETLSLHLERIERTLMQSPRSGPIIAAGGVVACELEGLILGVPEEEWRMAAFHALRGVMEPGVVTLFKRVIRPGMVIVDVGANVGLYTLLGARLTGAAGKVYSFEPAPRIFSLLMDNIQVNGYLETGIVIPKQLAVMDRSGTATLGIYRRNSGHNTLFGRAMVDEELQVETTSLDEALSSLASVDLVKMDAEGAEPWILQGMKQTILRNPALQMIVEFAPEHLRRAGIEPAFFLELMARMGLTYERIDDVSGELRSVTREELLACQTSNLFLVRDRSCIE